MNKHIFDNFGKVTEMSKIESCFITFNHVDGYDKALEVSQNGLFDILHGSHEIEKPSKWKRFKTYVCC